MKPESAEALMTGDEFRTLRKELGLSLNDIASKFRVNQSTVIRWQQRPQVPGTLAVLMRMLQREEKQAA